MAERKRSRNAANKSYAHIDGLRDFLKDVGVAKHEMVQAEQLFAAIAASTVVTRAKEIARTEGKLATKASADVKVAGPGAVSFGGQGFSFGAEFGALQYEQFKIWRGNQDDAGYFFWPAIREFRDEDMLNLWVEEVWKAIKPAFPDSR